MPAPCLTSPPAAPGPGRISRAYLNLGSNLDPQRHLRCALVDLRARFGTLTVSPIYRSKAFGFDGPDFLNLAVGLETDLEPLALRDWLQALETRHGRRRDVPRFSSHTLDIDIVLFGDLVLKQPGLELPRPDLAYPYVLKPLVDIAPWLTPPGSHKTLWDMWCERCEQDAGLIQQVDDAIA